MTVAPATPAPAPAGGPPRAAERHRAALLLAIEGDLRFLSHRDEMRLLERALIRADWPLRYSQGFNPQPRLTLPLPRPVGLASACDLALVDLHEPRPADGLAAALAAALPAGCRLLRVVSPAARRSPQARGAEFELPLSPEDAATAHQRLAALLAATEIVAQRSSPGRPAAPTNVRPYLKHASLTDQVLRLRLAIDQQRSARPEEFLAALGLDPAAHAARWLRVNVTWDVDLAEQPDNPNLSRTNLGQDQ
jgi:radical SAM-linked protein